MKKKIYLVITMLLVYAMSFNASAITEQYTYEFEAVTVIFDANSMTTEQDREIITAHLVCEDENSTTYGLWCTLFGHSYETHSATKITHCVYDTDPRCLREIYEVQLCSRCEDTVSKLIGSAYITCCPEE